MAILISVFSPGYHGKTIDFERYSPCHRTTVAHFLNKGKWNDDGLEGILIGQETADAEVNTGAKAATAADVAIAAGAAVRMMRRPARKSRAMPLRRAARIPNMDDPGLSSGLQAGRIAESGEVRRSKGGAAEALDAGEWKKRQNCGRESRKADGGNLSACPCADVRIGA